MLPSTTCLASLSCHSLFSSRGSDSHSSSSAASEGRPLTSTSSRDSDAPMAPESTRTEGEELAPPPPAASLRARGAIFVAHSASRAAASALEPNLRLGECEREGEREG